MAALGFYGLAYISRLFSFASLEPGLADKLLRVFCPRSPSLLLFFSLTCFWFFVHAFVSPKLPAVLLPPSARRQHTEKTARLAKLERTCPKKSAKSPASKAARGPQGGASSGPRGVSGEAVSDEIAALRVYFISANANTTASLHALYLAPAALVHAVRSVILPASQVLIARAASQAYAEALARGTDAAARMQAEQAALQAAASQQDNIWSTYLAHWDAAPDFWDGAHDPLVVVSSYIMGSYFLWDCFECLRNVEIHQRAFLVHALLSLLAGTIQIAAPGIKLSGLCSLFAVSEISTPFLHFRWFLLQNGQAETPLFRFINALTVFLFISVRLVVVPFLVFWHYWIDCAVYRQHLIPQANISTLRMVFIMVLTLGWTLLNYFWGYLFFRSLCRKRKGGKKAAVADMQGPDEERKKE
ncbi:conserved hypothetical protein [Neospora caninum Liverpool]|uniref:TLC domain-containing protein n=1 Tax=Neospora caninum (strain Liverpool) TaxID=572307 RepID=F0VEB2_NEOCL|nr:conserved hypothetical protein [Neospora caninum Liverpool]CBZ52056.1 conserved hypothetical protein [Neospora caninum Liverpool]CEL66017.1 TPA: hypothetical protein BN1204_018460 [Neospora caninum Liverpool]|eukprot:XP_003882088.1 conserved hypothetical protein [Neospora caninum Liverpool]